MKIALIFLVLFVASALGAQTLIKPIKFKVGQIYKYDYSGHVLTGLPTSGSSLYSGYQLNSTVELITIRSNRPDDNGATIIKMQLTKIAISSLVEEVTDVEKAIFGLNNENPKEEVVNTLSLPVQFILNEKTDSFEWVEVRNDDAPWSVNIKKSIIDLLQVNTVGKGAIRSAEDYENAQLLEQLRVPDTLHSYGVYEQTLRGKCETSYQVVQGTNDVDHYAPGAEKLYFNIHKTRNFDNCLYEPSFAAHNWDRKGCVEYCKRFTASTHLKQQELNQHLPTPDETTSSCSCDAKESLPVDQYSTIRYNISMDTEYPVISQVLGSGKIVVDNHGIKFVVYTKHSLTFKIEQIKRDEPLIPQEEIIRVTDLIFTLFPYKGMQQNVPTHVIPVFNLLVARNAENLVSPTVDVLTHIAQLLIEGGENREQSKAAWNMVQVVQNLAHLTAVDLKEIYDQQCKVDEKTRYTNTEPAVIRQLFLDALAQVGTKEVAKWLEMVLEEKSLTAAELRQFIETLPRNTYAPSKTLLKIFKKQIKEAVEEHDSDKLSTFAVTYGKLIAKACRFEVNEQSKIETLPASKRWYSTKPKSSSRKSFPSEFTIVWPEYEERCNETDLKKYLRDLDGFLDHSTNKDLKTKIIISQALAHTEQFKALEILSPYIVGSLDNRACVGYTNASADSNCAFLRSSVIYSLHHMIPVSPKLLRTLVLPVFQNKNEAYELRLAAFTVFMASGPKPHELETISAVVKHETNRQVITMVRSILEETANLTQACHLPLATAAREILPTLPVYNLDGVYSKASYNEWYSEDRSTGFFANGQFVANNMSIIPRHGYLSFGSHWRSLTNSWFTLAYQQKGLESLVEQFEKVFSPEWFMNALTKKGERSGEKKIDQIFKDLGITERTSEDVKVKLFVKMYERTSLFTLDKYTIEAAYNQFTSVVLKFIGSIHEKTDYNWVRFYMPSGYVHVIPSDIGLPVVVMKQRPHIVALRLEGASIKPELANNMNAVALEAKITPQLYYVSSMSVSAFQHGLKKNFGAYSLKKTTVNVPVKISVTYDLSGKVLTYAVEPTLEHKVIHFSNINRAFQGINYVGLPYNESPMLKKVLIQTRVPPYKATPRVPSKELGMDLDIDFETERPWFFDFEKIACKGLTAWSLEKYQEMNEFNFAVAITLRANSQRPSTGIAGSFAYNNAFSGTFNEVKYVASAHERSIIKKLEREARSAETEQARLVKQDIREVAEKMVQNYPGIDFNKVAPTLTRAVAFTFRTLTEDDGSVYNATLYLIQGLNYQTYWAKYVSTLEKGKATWLGLPRMFQIESTIARPALLSELKWELPSLNKLTGKYAFKATWGEQIAEDANINLSGELIRTAKDEVVGEEMRVKSWYDDQCTKDINEKIFMSYACQLVAQEQSYYNRITGNLLFKNIEPQLANKTSIIFHGANYYVNSFWRPWSSIFHYYEKHQAGKITFEAKHSNALVGNPVINFEIRTPHHTTLLYRLFFPIERFPGFHPHMFQKASLLPKDQTCALMPNHIRTFDNVTYERPSTKCETVLTMDCSPARRFAVTVKEVSAKREVKVLIGKHEIVVQSVDKYQAKLLINNEEKYVKPGKTHVVARFTTANIDTQAIRIFLQNDYLVVEAPLEHVRVVTDGQSVKVVTSPIYMGKTCGICGNQDQEAAMELQGPQNCLFARFDDFQNIYSLEDECRNTKAKITPVCGLVPNHGKPTSSPKKRFQPRENRRVYDRETIVEHLMKFSRDTDVIEEMTSNLDNLEDSYLQRGSYYLPVRKTRTMLLKGNKCFSKYPVPTCRDGEEPTATHQMEVAFTCVVTNPLIDQWEYESAYRYIKEVHPYDTTHLTTLKVPAVCLVRA